MKFERYDIDLQVDFKNLTFHGNETITFEAADEQLMLNSAELDVLKAVSGGEYVDFSLNEKEQTLHFNRKFNGRSQISIEFKGKVSESLQGLYIARYAKDQYILSTQFESTGARFVFPCKDEPAYKAIFGLSVTTGETLSVISNMPEKSSRKSENGNVIHIFEETPRVSTYLIYLGIGVFEERKIQSNGLECILAAPRGLLNSSDIPSSEAISFIREYGKYFGIKYVLPKVHLISVPEFAAGAMENWGAITFREVLLLVNEGTSTSIRQTISEVIAHELAHQWFGNLVTMKWWNDLWLNESFATFMAFKMVDRTHPEWEFMNRFLQSETSGALTGDSLSNSHPIDADVKNPDDIAQIFDEISYGKGASILRMIETYVGEDNFREGIRRYLKKYQYGNAMGSDLWNSIEEASGMPVSKIMEAWVKRKGYPIISVKEDKEKLKISQKQFLLNGKTTDEKWPVPLIVKRENGVQKILMEDSAMDIPKDGFLKLNHLQSGFYRVQYSDALWENIQKNIQKLHKLDLREILSDLFASLKGGIIDLSTYIRRIEPFQSIDDFVVVEDLSGQLYTLVSILPENHKLKDISLKYFNKQMKKLGDKKKGESENVSILRSSLASYLAVVDDDFAGKLERDFSRFHQIDPDMRHAVSIAEGRIGGKFDPMLEMYKSVSGDEDRIKILAGIGWLSGDKHNQLTLSMIKDGSVKKQDIIRVYSGMAANPMNRKAVFDVFPEAMELMERNYRGTGYPGMMAENLIPIIGLGREDAMKTVAEKVMKPSNSSGIKKGLELLEINSRLRRSS
ncbi:MAG: M1 family metallopeptidase [Candidatus Thermoplasmatota archaeon]|nr:M1 family metallopeptidase [Candidatus Thermoplasmatota archaeon]